VGQHELKIIDYSPASFLSDITYHLTVQELNLPRAVMELPPRLATANLPKSRFEALRANLVAAEGQFKANKLEPAPEPIEFSQQQVHLYIQPDNDPLASELHYPPQRIIIAANRRLGIAPPPSPFETDVAVQPSPVSPPPPRSSSAGPSDFVRGDFWLPDGP